MGRFALGRDDGLHVAPVARWSADVSGGQSEQADERLGQAVWVRGA